MDSDYHLLNKDGQADGIQVNTGDVPIVSSANDGDLRVDPPPGDGESRSQKDLKEVRETCMDFLYNPFEFISLLFFFLAAIFGVAVFIVRWVGLDDLDIPTCLILFVVGCLAAFEYRVYGGMFHQISVLGGMVDEFEEETAKIQFQIDGLGGENEELKQNIDNLKGKTDELAKVHEELDKKNNELHATSSELQDLNTKMQQDVEKLGREQIQLEENSQSLTAACDGLKGTIENFGEIKEELAAIAEQSNLDIMEFVNNMNSSYEKWDELLYQNELTLLRTRADKMEMRDDELGLSKTEFTRMVRTLPVRYRDIIKDQGITFESLAGQDGIIDPQELTDLIDRLIKEHMEREKAADEEEN